MKRVLLLIVLLSATGALWGWAHWSPKAPADLPERLQGTFNVYRIEPPEGMRVAPYSIPPGQAHYYTFRADGTYAISIRVSGDYEMAVTEGVARVDGEIVTLEPRSLNRRAAVEEAERYRFGRGQDEGGEFLLLELLPVAAQGDAPPAVGYLIYLRPATLP